MDEKDLKMSVREFATMIIATILIFVFVGAGIGYVITYNQMKEQDCPDCVLDCPDVNVPDPNITYYPLNITYYPPNVTVDFDEQAILDAIENSEESVLSKMKFYFDWLHLDHNWMNAELDDIDMKLYQGILIKLPADSIEIANYTENTSFQFRYFDNKIENFTFSPTFYWNDWTEILNWTYQQTWAISGVQRLFIYIVTMSIAYYEITGEYPPLG